MMHIDYWPFSFQTMQEQSVFSAGCIDICSRFGGCSDDKTLSTHRKRKNNGYATASINFQSYPAASYFQFIYTF